MKRCNQQQIDDLFKDSEQSAYKFNESSEFFCFDNTEEIEFLGFFDSELRQHLEISIDFGCDIRSGGYLCGCTNLTTEIYKDQTFELRWLTRQNKYSPLDLGEKTLQQSIISKRIPLSQFEGQTEYELKEHIVESSEGIFGLSTEVKSFYTLDPSQRPSSKRQGDQLLKINIGLSPDRQIWSRKVKNVLIWIKNFGGLIKGLSILGSTMIWCLNKFFGDRFSYIISKRLFKTDDPDFELLTTRDT